jgi:hypothetical protein
LAVDPKATWWDAISKSSQIRKKRGNPAQAPS